MASIITEQFRKNSADLLLNDVDANSYYIGIGKSDQWYETLGNNQTAPFPKGTEADARNVQHALTDMIRVSGSGTALVIPRVTPTASFFKEYDPYDSSCFYPSDLVKPCYFIDDNTGNVYLIISSPANTSLDYTTPTTSPGNIFNADSGHMLAHVGQIELLSKFNNEQFVKISTTLGTGDYAGNLYGFSVINGGLFDTTETHTTAKATVYATYVDGTTLSADVNVDCILTGAAGQKTIYRINCIDSPLNALSDSTTLVNTVVELSNFSITPDTEPLIAGRVVNSNGFGYDVTDYTPAWYVCALTDTRNPNATPDDVYSQYSQVSLLKNPKDSDGNTLSIERVKMLKSFTLATYSIPSGLQGYSIIQKSAGNIVKRIGVVDSYDADSVVYYSNNIKFGFDTPNTGLPIILVSPTGVETDTGVNPSSLTSPDFTPGSAKVMFIDNRATIIRSADQNEELKIIIQL